jgi:hypothetical protein
MIPGGHGGDNIDESPTTKIQADAGILWYLEWLKNRYGAWAPPGEADSAKDTGTSKPAAGSIVEKDGLVSIEAEHATRIKGWVPVAGGSNDTTMEDRGAKGVGYMEYDISFTKTGTYIIWVRNEQEASCASDRCNDCFADMDGNKLDIYEGSSCTGHTAEVIGFGTHSTSLKWQSRPKTECGADRSGKHVSVNIATTGMHTLKIGSRSKQYRIDKIVMMHVDLGIKAPDGNGPAETVDDQAVLARRSFAPETFLLHREYSNTIYSCNGRSIPASGREIRNNKRALLPAGVYFRRDIHGRLGRILKAEQ